MPFQESVMWLFANVCDIPFGSADSVRRVIAKKYSRTDPKQAPYILAVEKQWFEGCDKHGIDRQTAQEYWDKIEANSEYGFNKSHSDSYSVLSYENLWYRYNFPLEFCVARMTIKPDEQSFWFQKLAELGYEVLAPNVNLSHPTEYTIHDGKVLMPFIGLRGFGISVAEEIANKRPYTSIAQFESSVSSTIVNKSRKIALYMMGCFKGLSGSHKDLSMDREVEEIGGVIKVTHHKSKKEVIVTEFKNRYDIMNAYLNNAIIYSEELVKKLKKLREQGYSFGVITKIEDGVTSTNKANKKYYCGQSHPSLYIGSWSQAKVDAKLGRELVKGDYIAFIASKQYWGYLEDDNIQILNHLV